MGSLFNSGVCKLRIRPRLSLRPQDFLRALHRWAEPANLCGCSSRSLCLHSWDACFCSSCRSAALALRAPTGGTFWLITAHLDPKRALHHYQASLDNLENLFTAAPLGATIIASIDANDSLALPDSAPSATVGPHFAGYASRKGILLRALLVEYGLVAANTWTQSGAGAATCFYDGKYTPKQIDFICISADMPRNGYDCRAVCTMASKSDHCPVKLRIFAGRAAPTITPQISAPFATKPIGWAPSSSSYFPDLRNTIIPIATVANRDAIATDTSSPDVTIFTDGHFRKRGRNSRVRCAWGFAAFRGPNPTDGETEFFASCGPVTLNSVHPLYLGATKRTNNTGEVSAMIEALIWVLAHLSQESRSIHFVVDSSYVLNIVTARCIAKHNILLTTIMKFLWDKVQRVHRVTIAWVKSHTGVYGNERADELANLGDQDDIPCLCRIHLHAKPCHHLIDDSFIDILNTIAMPADEMHYHRCSRPRSLLSKDKCLLLANPILRYVHPLASSSSTSPSRARPFADSDDDDESPAAHMLHLADRPDLEGAPIVTLMCFATGVARCARSHGSVPRKGRPRLHKSHPLISALKDVTAARSVEPDPAVRHVLGLRLVELKHAVAKAEFDLRVEACQARGCSMPTSSYGCKRSCTRGSCWKHLRARQ